MTHLLSYIAVAMASASLAVLVFACLCAGSRADDWAETFHAQLNREEVERRTLKAFDEAKAEATLYDALRKAQ